MAAVKKAIADTAGGTRCLGTPVNWVPETGVVGFDPGFAPDGKTALGAGKVWGLAPTAEEDATFVAGVFPFGLTAVDAERNLHLSQPDVPPLFKVQGNIRAMLKGLAKFEVAGKSGIYVYAISVNSTTNPTRSQTIVLRPFTVGPDAADGASAVPPDCKPGNGCTPKVPPPKKRK